MLHKAALLLDPEVAHKVALAMIKCGLIRLPWDRRYSTLNSRPFSIPIHHQELTEIPVNDDCAYVTRGIEGRIDDQITTSNNDLCFPSPVGLAAGFDKNADCMIALMDSALGFAEFGTVTPKPQIGNPKPRIFRYAKHKAIINRLGFPNKGAVHCLNNIRRFNMGDKPYGINIGKNADSKNPIEDYVSLFNSFYGLCSYIVINISSPNTVGLRKMQDKEELEELLSAISNARNLRGNSTYTPYLVKISPDLDEEQIKHIAELLIHYGADGAILTNTTVHREVCGQGVMGGLSGAPLMTMSNRVLHSFYIATKGKVPLVGVGGIMGAGDAYKKIRLGASLVQLYTGFVYKGFGLIEEINKGLVEFLRRDGFNNIAEAVGVDAGNIQL